MRDFESPIDAKNAFYHMASKAELVNRHAKIWFERPAYGIYQGRRDDNEALDGTRKDNIFGFDAGND